MDINDWEVDPAKEIIYNGISYKTKHYGKDLSYDNYFDMKQRFYEKPPISEVR
jgi:hypothetical protein